MNIITNNMWDLSSKRRDSACGCETPCKTYKTITDRDMKMITVCEAQAIQIARELLKEAPPSEFKMRRDGWTTKQEHDLIEYIKINGVQYGTASFLARKFDKDHGTVGRKIKKLREEGRL